VASGFRLGSAAGPGLLAAEIVVNFARKPLTARLYFRSLSDYTDQSVLY
jgi:hypothetical protein